MRWIFLISVLPYIIDFFLILSYPNSLNERVERDLSVKKFWMTSIKQVKNIFKKKLLAKILISSSLYDAIFKTIKDYIQPILKITILGAGIKIFSNLEWIWVSAGSQVLSDQGRPVGLFKSRTPDPEKKISFCVSCDFAVR